MAGFGQDIVMVYITAPSEEAESLARTLVEEELAACVNVLPSVCSIYRWQGTMQKSEESLLIVKTIVSRLTALEQRVQHLHSYEVPEILSVSVVHAYPPYADWVRASVKGHRE
jgi:periplasmic divalent cation tolerance protein